MKVVWVLIHQFSPDANDGYSAEVCEYRDIADRLKAKINKETPGGKFTIIKKIVHEDL